MVTELTHPETSTDPQSDAQRAVVGSSFYAAMRVLPSAQRRAMFEIYRFCRTVDDIADGDGNRQVRLAELARWRLDVDALFKGTPPSRVHALVDPIRQFDLQREDFFRSLTAWRWMPRRTFVPPPPPPPLTSTATG